MALLTNGRQRYSAVVIRGTENSALPSNVASWPGRRLSEQRSGDRAGLTSNITIPSGGSRISHRSCLAGFDAHEVPAGSPLLSGSDIATGDRKTAGAVERTISQSTLLGADELIR
jgi:hypothetical protein